MSSVTRHTLRVYAALMELKGGDRDVLDALIPFFDPVLSLLDGKIFDPYIFASGVRKLYRWRFTGDVAESFIPRLEKRGILKREAHSSRGSIWVVHYNKPIKEPSSGIIKAFDQIVDEFERFPPRVTDLLSYNKTREDLQDLLIRFLVTMDSPGEGAFTPELGELEPDGQAKELMAKLQEGGRPLEPADRYMCARFVQHLIKTRPDFSTHLARLASIALLTEVVEDFVKPIYVEQKVDLTVALDAPIAMDYLGCSGRAFKEDIQAVVSSLRNIGVKFIVFPASCQEMRRNLQTMLSLSPDQRRGYTHNALIRREVEIDYVRAVANNPERALEQAGIPVRSISLETNPHAHRFFTEAQYEDFFSSITWGNQIAAAEHDATCAALIMRLREGQHSSDIFKCRYALVTRNPTFVRHARNYCLQSRMINHIQEGPIIFQRELATVAWLRTGLGAEEAIPRGHLVTVCDRVLQARPEVRNAVAMQLAKITPERIEQFNLLMQDARSVQKLSDQTLNDEKVVTSENVEHLLDVMREATAEEIRERYAAELEAQRNASEEAKHAAQKEMDRLAELHEAELRAQRQLIEQRNAQAADEINELKERMRAIEEEKQSYEDRLTLQLERIVGSFNRVVARIEWSVVAVLLLFGVSGAYNFFTHALDNNAVWNWIPMALGVVGFLRLALAILERPMPGLKTLIAHLGKRYLRRKAESLGIEPPIIQQRVGFSGGRLFLRSAPDPTGDSNLGTVSELKAS